MGHVDWSGILVPDTPLLEIFIRGTLVYLGLFAMLRVVLKRQSGTVGETDLLVVVLIADASQNAMAGAYTSVPDGLLLVATILFWSYALEWLGYRFPRIRRLLRPPPLPLVKDGQMLRRNMRQELMSPDELMSLLRQQGFEDLSQVKEACMEANGRLSVVGCDQKPRKSSEAEDTPL
jgi:uncharacterized membrane protein YcaP (DUF421 family)